MSQVAVVACGAGDNEACVNGGVHRLGHLVGVAGPAEQAFADAEVDDVGALLDTPVDAEDHVGGIAVAGVIEDFCGEERDVVADAAVLESFGGDYAGDVSPVAVIVHCVFGLHCGVVLCDDLVDQVGMRVIDSGIDYAYLDALAGDGVVPGVVGPNLIRGVFEKGVHAPVFLEALEAGQLFESLCPVRRYFNHDFVFEPAVVMDDPSADALGGLMEERLLRLQCGFGEPLREFRFLIELDDIAFELERKVIGRLRREAVGCLHIIVGGVGIVNLFAGEQSPYDYVVESAYVLNQAGFVNEYA